RRDNPRRGRVDKTAASRPPNELALAARTDAPPDLVVDASQSAPADVDPAATTGCTEPPRCCGRDHLELDEVLFGIPAQHREDVGMAVAVRIDDRPELTRSPPKQMGRAHV